MTHQIATIVNELPSASDVSKQSHLEAILSSLSKMSKSEIQGIVDQINVRHIVDCVTVETDTSLAILQRLCDSVETSYLLDKFEPLFIQALTSEHETILRMCLVQLQRIANECSHCFSNHMNIIFMLMELLFADETGCLKLIEAVLVIVGKHHIEMFTSSEATKLLENIPAEKQLRIYDVIIEIAVSSEASLNYFLSSGVFKLLVKIYQHAVAEDPLLLLNCLELFSNIVVVQEALAKFEADGLIANIFRDMVAAKTSTFASILLPAFIKMFTSVGRTNFSLLLSKYTQYFDLLDASCRNPADIGTCLVGLESFAILGQIPESKELLASDRMPNLKVEEWLRQLRSFLMRGGSDDVQAKAILICADLFTVPKHVTPTKPYYDTNARWFNVLFDSRFDNLMQWAKSPLAERHVAAQRVLIALSVQPWAQQLMAGTAGFTDFLVDRATETDKMGRELKYELVQSIFMSSTTASYFDGPDVVKLGVYVRQGPFYSTATTVVGMEAES